MSFTATGPILLLLVVYVFIFRPRRLAYCALFFAPFSATAIVNLNSVGYKTGGLGLTPAMAFTISFFIAQIVYGYAFRRVRIGSGHLIQLGFIGLFLAIVYYTAIENAAMGTIINPVTTHTVYMTIGLLATTLFSLEFLFNNGIERAIVVIRASVVFVSVWGLLQFLLSIVRIPYPSILFNNSNSDAADMFAQDAGNFARIASVAVEPSVMAASLLHFAAFGVAIIARDARFRTWPWIGSVGIVLITLLISTSSTAYIGLLIIAFLLLLDRPILATILSVPIITAFLGILFSWSKAMDIFLSSTVNKSESYSYADRSMHSFDDFNLFLQHPFLGWGWGRAINFNGFFSLLSNVGIIGTVVFLTCGALTLGSLYLGAQNASPKDWKIVAYAVGVRNALIVAAVCGVTSGMKYVFLDDWVFWGLGIAIASSLEIRSWNGVNEVSPSLEESAPAPNVFNI